MVNLLKGPHTDAYMHINQEPGAKAAYPSLKIKQTKYCHYSALFCTGDHIADDVKKDSKNVLSACKITLYFMLT